ncbi:hypothetical protein BHE74_00055715, partial [Ensete ventricosum]
ARGSEATGNCTSRCCGARAPAMAAVSVPAPASTFNLAGLFSDPPPPLRPSGEQIKYCSEALYFFKEKLRTPTRIAQEFHRLQVSIDPSLASLASGEKVSQFIATQGPLPETFEDFWEMVFEYRCPAIVMLTRVDNHRLVKPALSVLHIQYPEWPDHGVPDDTASVREIFEMTHHLPPEIDPIVVHCRFRTQQIAHLP